MTIAAGWTLTGSHVGGHFGNTRKKLSVVTLWPCNTTPATGPAHRRPRGCGRCRYPSLQIRLSIVCDGETSAAISMSAHPTERPAALNQKESSVRADRVKATTGKLSICAKGSTYTCVYRCVCTGSARESLKVSIMLRFAVSSREGTVALSSYGFRFYKWGHLACI